MFEAQGCQYKLSISLQYTRYTMDDFRTIPTAVAVLDADTPDAKKKAEKGKKRAYMVIYENLPNTMMNMQGVAKYVKLTDPELWTMLCKPQKTGAIWHSEFCDPSAERRGIGMNRFLLAMKLFMEYQQEPAKRQGNDFLMRAELVSELYAEIDRVLPSIVACLAPKKEYRGNQQSLRAAAHTPSQVLAPPDEELNRHATVIFHWLQIRNNVSRVRMMLHWQSAGGLTHIAAVHHRAAQVFKYCGNHRAPAEYDANTAGTTLSEFQECIRARWSSGSSGINDTQGSSVEYPQDFTMSPGSVLGQSPSPTGLAGILFTPPARTGLSDSPAAFPGVISVADATKALEAAQAIEAAAKAMEAAKAIEADNEAARAIEAAKVKESDEAKAIEAAAKEKAIEATAKAKAIEVEAKAKAKEAAGKAKAIEAAAKAKAKAAASPPTGEKV